MVIELKVPKTLLTAYYKGGGLNIETQHLKELTLHAHMPPVMDINRFPIRESIQFYGMRARQFDYASCGHVTRHVKVIISSARVFQRARQLQLHAPGASSDGRTYCGYRAFLPRFRVCERSEEDRGR